MNLGPIELVIMLAIAVGATLLVRPSSTASSGRRNKMPRPERPGRGVAPDHRDVDPGHRDVEDPRRPISGVAA